VPFAPSLAMQSTAPIHPPVFIEVATLMDLEMVKYLRECALTCSRLARTCPHLPTAHELEGLAAELMAKAEQFEQLQE
jgi:hypothetical protein